MGDPAFGRPLPCLFQNSTDFYRINPLLENMSETRTEIPRWLKHLQENSWEVELLISGGAVFTLVQLPEPFMEWMRNLRILTDLPGYSILLVIGMVGLKILTNGFILHLMVRAWWLALVCLNYIYPQGINYKRVNQNRPFASSHVHGDLQQQIMAVDRQCGLVIFMAIISTLILGGFVFSLLVFLGALYVAELLLTGWLKLGVLLFFEVSGPFVVAYLVDLLGMGWLRRIPHLSWLFALHFRLFDWLTLRPLYSRALVLFSSNVRRLHFIAGAVVFAAFTLLSVYLQLFDAMQWGNLFDRRNYLEHVASGQAVSSSYYKDESDGLDRGQVYIPSRIADHNLLEVNLRYAKLLDGFIENSNLPDSLKTLENIISLAIDDSVYASVVWHPANHNKSSEMTVMAMVPIAHLTNGLHIVRVKAKEINNPQYQEWSARRGREIRIPFWKDVW